MKNAELVKEISGCVIHPTENTNVGDMIKALDEYLHAVPGRKNEMPTCRKISARDSIVVLKVFNAFQYFGYKPEPLTDAERDMFHPEREPWLDRVPHFRKDYIVYRDFLDEAIKHLQNWLIATGSNH